LARLETRRRRRGDSHLTDEELEQQHTAVTAQFVQAFGFDQACAMVEEHFIQTGMTRMDVDDTLDHMRALRDAGVLPCESGGDE
jgi:hypothetical protein